MEIIKKIMEALWTLQQAFIRCDTGAFIYGINDGGVSGDNYLSGKHSKLYEEKVIRFYAELDGNNRTHLHETLLAYAGKFTIPFVVRMMEMTRWVNDKTNRPYVRYFSRADRNDVLYLLFELPGKGHKVLTARWENLLNSDAYEYNTAHEQMYLYLNESGFPKNQGFNVATIIPNGECTFLDDEGELWADGVLLADTPKSCVGLMKKHTSVMPFDLRRAEFIIDLPDAEKEEEVAK